MDNPRRNIDNGLKDAGIEGREALLGDCRWRNAAIGAGSLGWAG